MVFCAYTWAILGYSSERNLVPISEAAKRLSLPLHEIDTFTGWEVSEACNPHLQDGLILCKAAHAPGSAHQSSHCSVIWTFCASKNPWSSQIWRTERPSFYAARVCRTSVFPTVELAADLGSFHGPAPLHHTLLSGSPWTGVTIQTLHPKHFDQGLKLLQHEYPGVNHNCVNVEKLSELLAVRSGNMLVDCIRNHLYLYGSALTAPTETSDDFRVLKRHAPKITTADRFIDWTVWTGEEIMRRHQVIGPLWSLAKPDEDNQRERRIIWSTGFETTFHEPIRNLPVGQPVVTGNPSSSRVVHVQACDGQVLKVGQIKIEGGEQAEPLKSAELARMNDPSTLQGDGPLFRTQILSTLPEQYRDQKRSSLKDVRKTHSL